jgi:hypothetical protein
VSAYANAELRADYCNNAASGATRAGTIVRAEALHGKRAAVRPITHRHEVARSDCLSRALRSAASRCDGWSSG